MGRCRFSPRSGFVQQGVAVGQSARYARTLPLNAALGVKEDMKGSLISVKDFAEENGLLKQTVFKVIKRLGIEPQKSRGGSQNRGQTISYITEREAQMVLDTLASTMSARAAEQRRGQVSK